VFIRREDADRFIEEVGAAASLSLLFVCGSRQRELEAGGLN
jgi:hypothetical protein